MGFVEAVKSGFAKYAVFSGRATRPEFWYFVLFTAICNVVATLLDTALGLKQSGAVMGILRLLVILATTIPHIAVTVRRLHDTDRSGWWYGALALSFFIAGLALGFLPALGTILMVAAFLVLLLFLFWLVSAGTPGPNRYGPPSTAPNALPVLE